MGKLLIGGQKDLKYSTSLLSTAECRHVLQSCMDVIYVVVIKIKPAKENQCLK